MSVAPRVALLVTLGLAACERDPARGRERATVAGAASDTVPAPGRWSEDGCGIDTTFAHPDAAFLMRDYALKDAAGEFTASGRWLDGAVECPRRLPGFDEATLVARFRVTPIRAVRDTVLFVARYERHGRITPDDAGLRLVAAPGIEIETLTVVRTPYGWRIGGTVHQPHLDPAGARATLQLRPADRAVVDSLLAATAPSS